MKWFAAPKNKTDYLMISVFTSKEILEQQEVYLEAVFQHSFKTKIISCYTF